MKPRGATELQMEMLHKHVPKELLDQVQICTSIPGKVPIDPNKVNILWQKNSWDQPNLQEFFSNKERHKEYDWYVFNSHWNYEKFRYFFDIPTDRSVVIKNGTDNFPKRRPYQKGKPIKILHHNTPWRGLNVLLRAMQEIKDPNITLDVYSSTQVYGEAFKKQNTKFLVISFSSDWLYTTKENKDIVIALNASGADVSYSEIVTDKGHDSFLLNEPEFLKTLKGFIDSMYEKFKNEKRI